MSLAAQNILSSIKVPALRNFLRTECMFWARRDWDDCTLAVSYQEISNLKRNITSGCPRLKRLSSVFSRSPLDCAREKYVFLFFVRFSFHLRTMRARKSIVNKSVYPRIKEHKTLALLYIVIFTK